MTKPHIPLDEIRAQVEGCRKCPLADGRTQTVFGVGNPEARVMIIGEAPGKNEDLQGEPFVGAAGKYLNELLAVAGLVREDVFIANVLKCRPPGNRDPRPEEIELCTPYLREQTRTIDPEFLVTLGNFSTKFILKTDIGITRLHGTVQRAGKFKVFPIFHPAAALYDGSKREALENDFATLGELLRASEAERAAEAAAKAAEGKVHIPRDNGEIAVLLIEIIVMRGIAEVAVKVRQCHIRRNIFQRRFHIQQILQILAILKRLHQSDDFLAVRGILVCFQVQSCVGGNIIPVINQIRTCAILSFGLIKVARCIIKMGLKEGFIYCLHCQIQPPFLTVDGNVAVAALGDIQSKLAHDFIGNIFAHAAVVGIVVIQTKLFQAVIIAVVVIVIKIQLKAVTVGIGIGHRGQAVVALRANCHIPDSLPVNRHIRLVVFLLQRVFQHILPVRFVNFNVDFVYRILLEDVRRIGIRRRIYTLHHKI